MDNIKKILKTEFQKSLFDSAIENLNDKSNKLRYNNFAYSIRELSRHFLHSLSPDNQVINCNWFIKETHNGAPSRSQRIKYAVKGGLSDEYIEQLGLDLEELRDTIIETKRIIDSLSKYTHINEDTYNLLDDEVTEKSSLVLSTFSKFVMTILDYRDDLRNEIDRVIHDQIFSEVTSTIFSEIDILSTHHYIEHSDVEEFEVVDITSDEICVEVSGYVHVVLEYGSKNERREDDGLDLYEYFAFDCSIKYKIDDDFPSKNYTVEDLAVDTSEWYDDYE
ncbi:hypothetical protein DVK85_05285 [Flavobacterium arcticum]|uniref:Uncharacterized protein n=1 Tax=Flavobacterium arcticum TaxID=1784713 RepID=A0A345HAR4_9FLAO|nr:hypothetical protein [Flavobacterium arcticum]AXG73674.1 hypothetical protein DVK85_05285 [Flavobacterium arcticum]KAF2511625.1 hypothetical protein E0W72_04795 [Flavobacterium arcticum]